MNKKIWLFHETDDYQPALLRLLQAQGYQVVCAKISACVVIVPTNADLILLDPSLSRRTIFEVCHQLKKSWWVRSVSVIAFSSDCQPAWIRQSYALGVDYYVFQEKDNDGGEQVLTSLLKTVFGRQRCPYRISQYSQIFAQ